MFASVSPTQGAGRATQLVRGPPGWDRRDDSSGRVSRRSAMRRRQEAARSCALDMRFVAGAPTSTCRLQAGGPVRSSLFPDLPSQQPTTAFPERGRHLLASSAGGSVRPGSPASRSRLTPLAARHSPEPCRQHCLLRCRTASGAPRKREAIPFDRTPANYTTWPGATGLRSRRPRKREAIRFCPGLADGREGERHRVRVRLVPNRGFTG